MAAHRAGGAARPALVTSDHGYILLDLGFRISGDTVEDELRLGERGPVGQCAREILAQTRAGRPRKRPRMLQPAGERLFALGQPERLQHRLAAVRVRADEAELAQIRHQHQAVAPPVARHLLAHRLRPQVLVRRLHLDDAALRSLSLARTTALDLLRGVEPEIGMARALVGELADAEHPGLQRRTDRVQESRERPRSSIAPRWLRRRRAPGADRRGTSRPPWSASCSSRPSCPLSSSPVRHASLVADASSSPPRARNSRETALGIGNPNWSCRASIALLTAVLLGVGCLIFDDRPRFLLMLAIAIPATVLIVRHLPTVLSQGQDADTAATRG